MFGSDPRKARTNLRKHGISFTEADTVFDDPAVQLELDVRPELDDALRVGEDRWRARGRSDRDRLLIVSFSYRYGQRRIISARRATKRERHDFEA